MKKLTVCIFALLIFSITTIAAEESKIKVLAILPLSGDIAVIGTAVKNGILMGVEKSSDIKIEFEDDAGIPKNTVSALRKHLSTTKPSIVIAASSSTSKSIAPILEEEKIPLIAIATDEQISKNKNYAVNFWVTPDEEAKVLILEANKRNYKNIAIFSTIHEGSMSIKRKFLDANNKSLNIVFDEDITPDLKDFRSIITKFKAKTSKNKPDAIFTNIFFGQTGIFARQLREMGIKEDLFCVELFEDENEVKSSNGALINQWYVQADEPSNDFLKQYSAKYSKSSYFGAANGLDAISLIIKAVSEQKKSSEDLNTFIHNVKDFTGSLGTFSSTGDNRFTLPATVKIVTKDGFKKLY